MITNEHIEQFIVQAHRVGAVSYTHLGNILADQIGQLFHLRRLLPENCFHIAYTGLIKVRMTQATVLNCAGAKKDYLF